MSRNIPFHLQLELTPQAERLPHIPRADNLPDTRSSMNPSMPESSKAASVPRPPSSSVQQTAAEKADMLAPLLTRGAKIRVTLQRQISIDVRSQKVLKTIVTGEGLLQRVKLGGHASKEETDRQSNQETPGASGSDGDGTNVGVRIAEDGNEVVQTGGDIDWEKDWAGWEGEVIPSKQIQVGGFRAGGLIIRVGCHCSTHLMAPQY